MRIPGGENFGQVVPVAPYQMRDPDRPEAASGAIVGRAITEAALGVAESQRRENEAARRLRDAADEATARGAMVAGRDQLNADLDELNAKVLSGEVAKDKAGEEWARIHKERSAQILEGVPQAHRQIVQQDLEHRGALGGRAISKTVMLRDQQDVRAGISQTMEHASRLYSSDPGMADFLAREALSSLSGAAGMTPVQSQAMLQSHLETTRENKAVRLINEARHSNKDLDGVLNTLKTEEFSPLDEKKRTNLYNLINNYKFNNDRAAEARERQAMARQDHHLKVAEAAMKSANDLSLVGALSPETIEQTRIATRGTPMESAFTALLENQKLYGSFASRPVEEQAATRQELERRMAVSASPELAQQLQKIKAVESASRTAAEKDGTSAYLARAGLSPMNLTLTTNAVQMAEQIKGLRELSAAATKWSGKPESGLTQDQADKLQEFLSAMPAKERAAYIREIALVAGPRMSMALANQMDGKDEVLAHQFMYSNSATTQGLSTTPGRYVSELIAIGAEAKKNGTSTKGDAKDKAERKENEWGTTISEYLGDSFANAKVNQKVRNAAEYIAHSIAAENGGNLSVGDIHRAAKLAAGGEVIEHNGRKTLVPVGVKSVAIQDKLRAIDKSQIDEQAQDGKVLAGGVLVPSDEFAKSLPGRQLVRESDGVYVVYESGRPVLGKGGKSVRVRIQ